MPACRGAESGTATPRYAVNAYNVIRAFEPSPCVFARQTLSGLACFDFYARFSTSRLGLAHLARVAQLVEPDEMPVPMNVRQLRSAAVVHVPDAFAQLIE